MPGNNEVALFVVLIAISNIVEEGFMGSGENEGLDIFLRGEGASSSIQCFAFLSIDFWSEK